MTGHFIRVYHFWFLGGPI